MANLIEHDAGSQGDRGHAILGVSSACGVLEAIAVALRFVARRKIGASYRTDDWLILLSIIPNYGMIVAGGFCESNPWIVVVKVPDENPLQWSRKVELVNPSQPPRINSWSSSSRYYCTRFS